MILSEFIRIYDISWEEFIWGSYAVVLVFIVFDFVLMMCLIPAIYRWIIKHIMPKWHDCKVGKLQTEVENLKNLVKKTEIRVRESENRTAEYRGRLERISNSADVKGE